LRTQEGVDGDLSSADIEKYARYDTAKQIAT